MPEIRLLTTTLTILLLASSQVQAGKIKCWTNSEGIRECGNIVPPEYAQKGHEVLNQQGVTVDKIERAKTPEELAEAKRLAAIKAEEKRLRAEQENRDRVLLDTFSSEDEIIMARDGKLTALKTEVRLTRKSMTKTRERLDILLKQAANLERAGKPVPDKLAADIKTATEQVEEYRAFISSRQSEQDRIKAKFEKDMARYKLLKSGKVRRPSLKAPETAQAR